MSDQPEVGGLSAQHWQTLQEIFVNRLASRSAKLWLFGSRAKGKHRPYSDVDLLLEIEPDLSSAELGELFGDLEESSVPYKIDLVTSGRLLPQYRDQVNADKVLIRVFN